MVEALDKPRARRVDHKLFRLQDVVQRVLHAVRLPRGEADAERDVRRVVRDEARVAEGREVARALSGLFVGARGQRRDERDGSRDEGGDRQGVEGAPGGLRGVDEMSRGREQGLSDFLALVFGLGRVAAVAAFPSFFLHSLPFSLVVFQVEVGMGLEVPGLPVGVRRSRLDDKVAAVVGVAVGSGEGEREAGRGRGRVVSREKR